MMDSCCRNHCRDNGLNDICKGVNCIIGGIGKGICSGIDVLNCMGSSLICQPQCSHRPCCRPRPHPPTCTCTCQCNCR